MALLLLASRADRSSQEQGPRSRDGYSTKVKTSPREMEYVAGAELAVMDYAGVRRKTPIHN